VAPTRLRIGVIGVGTRGRQHLTTIGELPGHFKLAAVCDRSAPAAEAVAANAGVPAYTSVHDFLANARLDVVLIATQAETHHLVAEAVAEHGLPMLIETPLGTTRAMMDHTANVVARAGVNAEVGENMWRRPTERLNQAAIAAGLIGDVVRVSSYYESAGQDSCYHSMSLLRLYAGADVDEVRAHSHVSSLKPPASETWTQAQLSYANGVMGTCTFVTGWIGPLRRGHPRFMSVEGTEGFVVTGDGDLNMLRRVVDGAPLSYPKLIEAGSQMPLRYYYETDPPVECANPHGSRVLSDSGSTGSASDGFARADELLSIHRVVTEGADPGYTIAMARRDQELSIAIHESARLDRPLRPERMPGETAWERVVHEAFRKQWGADPFKNAGTLLR
jgi:predicted dehydrogenase